MLATFGCHGLVVQVSRVRVPLMFSVRRFALLLLALVVSLSAAAAERTQYVLISFDGAQHIEQWQRSRTLARKTGASFTYFLSCVYLLTRDGRAIYEPPTMAAGRSNVGFAESREDVAQRLRQIWTARMEGHEIASHGCGHFDGGEWSVGDWTSEFQQFSTILADAWTLNGLAFEPEGWRDFARGEIIGFRAPYLSTNPALFDALSESGFAYDASTVSAGPAAPAQKQLVRFSLPTIPEGPKARPVIAMDYNLFVRHSAGIENKDEDGVFEERALAAFNGALEAQLAGERVPLQIGLHFTLMNGGAYWRALERFAEDACARPQVRCVSYRAYLEETEAQAQPSTGG